MSLVVVCVRMKRAGVRQRRRKNKNKTDGWEISARVGRGFALEVGRRTRQPSSGETLTLAR